MGAWARSATSGYQASATALPGAVITSLAAIARDIGAHILAGTVIEQDGDELHNTAVLISPEGEIVHTYRKVHLFGFDQGEAEMLTPGDDVSTYALPGLTTLGMTTCYDLRFPEMYRLLLDAGAQLVVVPAGWPAARLDHWLLLLRARALEDQLFVVGCNQVGTQEGVELAGHSVVVDPWGRIIAEAGTGEEVLTIDIDLAMVSEDQGRVPGTARPSTRVAGSALSPAVLGSRSVQSPKGCQSCRLGRHRSTWRRRVAARLS